MRGKRKCEREKIIHIRLTRDEYNTLLAQFQTSTCQYFTELLRLRLMGRPVVIRYRNAAADEFLAIALDIKTQLETQPNASIQQISTCCNLMHEIYEKLRTRK